MVGLDELDALSVDVEDSATRGCASICTFDAFGGYVSHRLGGSAVSVAAKLGVFEKRALLNKVLEFLL